MELTNKISTNVHSFRSLNVSIYSHICQGWRPDQKLEHWAELLWQLTKLGNPMGIRQWIYFMLRHTAGW